MSTTTPLSPTAPVPPVPPVPPAPPAPKGPSVALLIGAIVTGLMIVLAALSLFSLLSGRDIQTTHQSFGAPTGTTLAIVSGSADVTVVADSGSGVEVDQRTSTVHGRRVAPARLAGDRLDLPSSCVGGSLGWLFYCSVSYTVHVPSTLGVRVDVGSGDVTARGITAALSIRVGSGDVDGSALGSSTTVVHSGSGDVRLDFVAAPTSVTATTGSGDLRIGLPDDGGPYRVVEQTGSGDFTSHVDTSESSTRTINVQTGSGDLTIDYAH